MKYFLMVNNHNYPCRKRYFNTEKEVYTFLKFLKREGPVDKKGNILPMKNEKDYLIKHVSIIKIDESTLPYYRTMFISSTGDYFPDELDKKQVIKYLKKSGLSQKSIESYLKKVCKKPEELNEYLKKINQTKTPIKSKRRPRGRPRLKKKITENKNGSNAKHKAAA